MKKYFYLSLIIFLCNEFAIAQNNNVLIRQLGDEHHLLAEQIGSMNEIQGFQFGINNQAYIKQLEGSYNNIQMNQVGTNYAEIQQIGSYNNVLLNQSPLDLENEGDLISQSFNSQSISNSGLLSASFAQVNQNGNYNAISLNQAGTHLSKITQAGSNNNAEVNQRAGNYSDMNFAHNGIFNTALFNSNANKSVANIIQTGLENITLLNQFGANEADITQFGNGNRAELYQYGNLNAASIQQIGNNHAAFIEQIGQGNSISITQE